MADRTPDLPGTELLALPLDACKAYADIHLERLRAHAKHGEGGLEYLAFDNPRFLPVALEELGEVATAINDHDHGVTDDALFLLQLRKELVQTGAMVAAWIVAIDAHNAEVG